MRRDHYTNSDRASTYGYHYGAYGYGQIVGYPGYGLNVSGYSVNAFGTVNSAYSYPRYSYSYHFGPSFSYQPYNNFTNNAWALGRDWDNPRLTATGGIDNLYFYYWRGQRCGIPYARKHLAYRLGRKAYRFCRPVYYAYSSAWSNTYYQGDGYYYDTPRSYVYYDTSDEDDAQKDADTYRDGYRDGYYEGGVNESPFGAKDGRTRLKRSSGRDVKIIKEASGTLLASASKAYAEGDYETATEKLKDASIGTPTSSKIKLDLSQAAFAAKRYELSAFAMRRAIALNSSLVVDSSNPRTLFEDPEIYDTQIDALKSELKRFPRNGNLHFVLGAQQLLSGDKVAAKASLALAVKNNSGDNDAAKLLKSIAKD